MPKDAPSKAKPAARPDLSSDTDGGIASQGEAAGQLRTEVFNADTDSPAPETGETAVFDGASSKSQQEDTQALDEGQLAAETKKAAAPKAAPKASVIGDYKLLKKLGQGGMGAVFKAHQNSLDREVALKVLSKELAAKQTFVQRFLREARIMAKLDHPNIIRCFDVGEAMGHHYLAMEFVEGGSVKDWLEKLGKFELGDALLLVMTVARALEHAHERGLIHRDIKPDNVLLTKKGVIKLADLGLAKGTDDDLGLTKTGTGAGTPIYMAPEQARDVKHVDGRCDIYALGVMLYVFLTGKAPFEGNTLVELIEAKEKGKFKPIRSCNDEVPERLDLIVDKMLARDVKHRYATCTEVIAELDALGLANDQLGFLGLPATVPALNLPNKPAPATTKPVASGPSTRTAPASAASAQRGSSDPAAAAKPGPKSPSRPAGSKEPVFEGDFWYWNFKDPGGRTITKKLTVEQVTTMIKSGSIDAKAQLSKTLQGGYRSIGTYSEFESYFRGKIAEKRAGRGAEKYKSMLEEIEAEEARKQRMKGWRRFFSSVGSFVGLVVWVGVLVGIIVGGWFLYKKFFP